MPEHSAGQSPLSAELLASQLVELSRLKEQFESSKQDCVGGDDAVSEAEFDTWLKSFGDVSEAEANDFPRYRRCMNAFEAFCDKSNHIQHLPLLSPNSALAELAHLFPSLRDAPGLEPFDELCFEEWLKEEASLQAKHAAKLVFSVWEDTPQSFNLTEAFRDWDDEHREAYIAWFQRPLMPQRELWGKL